MFGTAAHLEHIGEMPMLDYNTWDVSRSTLLMKRALDVAVALPAVVLLSPVFALIAIAIKLDSRGPVFFAQMRAGLDGAPFRMFKFRTMIADAEEQLASLVRLDELREPMFKLQRDPRVTRVGRFLRRSSLDELPQLLNILGGSMSLVGPAPGADRAGRALPGRAPVPAVGEAWADGADAGLRARRVVVQGTARGRA